MGSISAYVFYGCASAAEVRLPSSPESIGSYAFSGCSAVSRIGAGAVSIGELSLPDGVQTIGQCAFQSLVLITKATVPDSVTSIGDGAFKGMSSLVELTVPFVGKSEDATGYESAFGYVFGTVSAGTTAYKTSQMQGYTTQGWTYKSSSITYPYAYSVPQSLRRVTVTAQEAIPQNAFYNLDLLETITLVSDCDTSASNIFTNCDAEVLKTLTPPTNKPWDGVSVASNYDGGTGELNTPYLISSPKTLAYLAQQVNGGSDYDDSYFKLTDNLNLSGYSLSIGDTLEHPFAGHFDGDGYKILNVTINSTSTLGGFFGYVTGEIKNLGLHDLTVTLTTDEDEAKAGMIAYLGSSAELSNVYAYAGSSITATGRLNTYAGGLVGYSEGTIDHCFSRAGTTVTSTYFKSYGGCLVGYVAAGSVTNSFATTHVSSKGSTNVYSFAGRLVGYSENESMIDSCFVNSGAKIARFDSGSESNTLGVKITKTEIVEWTNQNWNPVLWHLSFDYPRFEKLAA